MIAYYGMTVRRSAKISKTTPPDLENARKILNRGNELKNLLQIHDLTVLEGENELKTNSVLHAQTISLSPKTAPNLNHKPHLPNPEHR
jgi:hypothetical protein